jgi:hypothetical protein
MSRRKDSQADVPQSERDQEHPQGPEPDTMEGPGGRPEARGKEDARDNTTRRGER